MTSRWIAICAAMLVILIGCGDDDGIGPVDKGPAGRLYVLNQGDGTMYVYDTRTLDSLAAIDTRVGQPHYIEFDPDGQHFYITTLELTRGHIAKFDAATLEFIDSVSVPANSTAIAITSDSRYGYVCDFAQTPTQATRVRKYDLTSLTKVDSMQAGKITHDLKITSDGSVIVVTNRTSDNVTLIYTDEDSVTFVPMTENDPRADVADFGPMGVIIDHRDSLAFIACMDAWQVRVLDIAERRVVDSIDIPISPLGSPSGPTLLAISPDNDVLFLTTQLGNSVVAVRVSTKEILADIPLGTNGPFGITISDDGSRVYAACVGQNNPSGRVYVIDGHNYTKVDSIDVGKLSYGLIWHSL